MKYLTKLCSVGLGAILLIGATSANAEGNVRPVKDAVTLEECSACHIAYPVGLLPKASWGKILDTLGDHFGEDASLDDATTKHIRDYLTSHANTRLSVNASNPTLRITDFKWFNREHSASRRAYAKSHSNIGTISNCAGCHRGAEKGRFDDD
ncbi:MAG: cytochrome C [Rhodobacterales bacterium]